MFEWLNYSNTHPQSENIKSLSDKGLNLSRTRALVMMLANCSFVEQCTNSTSPDSTFSRTKWCCISMCFVCAWCIGFFANSIHPLLSSKITVAPLCRCSSSDNNWWSQMASLVACVAAIYSASVDESATVGWHFDCQLTGASTKGCHSDFWRQ